MSFLDRVKKTTQPKPAPKEEPPKQEEDEADSLEEAIELKKKELEAKRKAREEERKKKAAEQKEKAIEQKEKTTQELNQIQFVLNEIQIIKDQLQLTINNQIKEHKIIDNKLIEFSTDISNLQKSPAPQISSPLDIFLSLVTQYNLPTSIKHEQLPQYTIGNPDHLAFLKGYLKNGKLLGLYYSLLK